MRLPALHKFVIALALALVACTSASSEEALARADLDAQDPLRVCQTDVSPRKDTLSEAARCAALFITQNGYADEHAGDTASVVSESLEKYGSIARTLKARFRTLQKEGQVVCRGAAGRAGGYTVGFARAADTVKALGRAVTIDADFHALRVQHVDYALTRALQDTTGRCRRL